MTRHDLSTITTLANAAIAETFALWQWPDPPTLTPGMAEACIEAYRGMQRKEDSLRVFHASAGSDKTSPPPTPPTPSDDDEENEQTRGVILPDPDATFQARAIDALRDMAGQSGMMPKQLDWDRHKPADLPTHKHLYRWLGLPSWNDLAALTGLHQNKRGRSPTHMAAMTAKSVVAAATKRAQETEKEEKVLTLAPLAPLAPLALGSFHPLAPDERVLYDALHTRSHEGYLPSVWEWNHFKSADLPSMAMILSKLNLMTTRALADWAGLKYREPVTSGVADEAKNGAV